MHALEASETLCAVSAYGRYLVSSDRGVSHLDMAKIFREDAEFASRKLPVVERNETKYVPLYDTTKVGKNSSTPAIPLPLYPPRSSFSFLRFLFFFNSLSSLKSSCSRPASPTFSLPFPSPRPLSTLLFSPFPSPISMSTSFPRSKESSACSCAPSRTPSSTWPATYAPRASSHPATHSKICLGAVAIYTSMAMILSGATAARAALAARQLGGAA